MAGNKLSPRQKMINMMYLIFIAMMAMNMSKEVLSAFGVLEERLTESNEAIDARNTAFMNNLAEKAAEQEDQYRGVKEKADEINAISNEFDATIEDIKDKMMARINLKPEDIDNYEIQDAKDYLDQLLFNGDQLTEDGDNFVNGINNYREGVLEVLGDDPRYDAITADVKRKFNADPVTRRDGVTEPWINYNYEGFPLIASKTKMTQLQNDIKTTESEILSAMLAGQQAAALSFTQYNTLLESAKSAYYSGEEFDGSIVLGRVDPNTKPNDVRLTLDGTPLSEDQYTIESGKVKLNIGAGSPGDHRIEGNLIYIENGEETEIPVDVSFATISKPNAAVIAADKMNVVYRGVDNPMTISIPGIPDNRVNASGAGLSGVSGSKYVMRPSTGREVAITASGTMPDGEVISTKSMFRIKDIPRPMGTIRGEFGDGGPVRMQREGLEISTVGAILDDFDFDLNLSVTGFSFKVPGKPTIKVNGSKLNAAAISNLRSAKRGETVQIFDINANISGNTGYKLKKISPVFIELTN